MAWRSDHAAFQLFFKRCWRNAFWSLVVISCKSVRNTPPPPNLGYIKFEREVTNTEYYIFFKHSIILSCLIFKKKKSCNKKKKKKSGVILLIRVNCYQTASRWCFFFLSSPHIHPSYCQRRRHSGSVWGVVSSKHPDISFQDETVTSWKRLFAENSGAVVRIWPWGWRGRRGWIC